MVAPIPFLERLAPGAIQGGGVRPALLPRFAPVPTEAPFSEEVIRDPRGDSAAAFRDQRATEVERRIEQSTTLTAPQDIPLAPPPPVVQPTVISPPPHTATTPAMHPTSRAAAIAASPPVIATPTGHDQPPAFLSRTPVPRSDTSASPNAAATLVSTAQPSLDRVNTPLREPLVRPHGRTTGSLAPTEIHVTIDRIDVRAPATQLSGSSRPAATKRAPSSLSLADYLRQPRPGGVR
jgi:hypothetical protein